MGGRWAGLGGLTFFVLGVVCADALAVSVRVDTQGVTHYEFKGLAPASKLGMPATGPGVSRIPPHQTRPLPAPQRTATRPSVRYVASDAPSFTPEKPDTARHFLASRYSPDVMSVPLSRRADAPKTPRVVIDALLRRASLDYGVDLLLLQAVVLTESAYQEHAVSHKGAQGLMQLMPATAERFGWRAEWGFETLKDPQTNITAGTRYLAHLLKLYGGDLTLALAAYNAGEGAVRRYGNQVPRFPETQGYVKKVLARYEQLRQQPIQANAPPDQLEKKTITPAPFSS